MTVPPTPAWFWYTVALFGFFVVSATLRRLTARRMVAKVGSVPDVGRRVVTAYRLMLTLDACSAPAFTVIAAFLVSVGLRRGWEIFWAGAVLLPLLVIVMIEDLLYRKWVLNRLDQGRGRVRDGSGGGR